MTNTMVLDDYAQRVYNQLESCVIEFDQTQQINEQMEFETSISNLRVAIFSCFKSKFDNTKNCEKYRNCYQGMIRNKQNELFQATEFINVFSEIRELDGDSPKSQTYFESITQYCIQTNRDSQQIIKYMVKVHALISVPTEVGDYSRNLNNVDYDALYDDNPISANFSSATFGDNVNILIGNDNIQSIGNQSINKGDFDHLKKTLEKHHVSTEDIAELETVINDDNPDIEKKTFGSKVSSWLKKMFGKSVDASWKIGTDVAGKILTEAIKHFYGM